MSHSLKESFTLPWDLPLISIIPERKHPFNRTVLSKSRATMLTASCISQTKPHATASTLLLNSLGFLKKALFFHIYIYLFELFLQYRYHSCNHLVHVLIHLLLVHILLFRKVRVDCIHFNLSGAICWTTVWFTLKKLY